MTIECPREQDVFEAVAAGQWPDRIEPAPLGHVAGCTICGEIVRVAPPLQDDRDIAWRAAHVPNSGLVWWRAQLRARAEAARTAARPMVVVQTAAAVCGVAVMIAVVAAGFGSFARWVAWLRDVASSVASTVMAEGPHVSLTGNALGGVVLAAVAGLILASVAVYLVTADE